MSRPDGGVLEHFAKRTNRGTVRGTVKSVKRLLFVGLAWLFSSASEAAFPMRRAAALIAGLCLLALATGPAESAQFQTGGAVTAGSTGTSVTCGENTKGSWIELIASTSFAVKHVVLYYAATGTNATSQYAIDLATGGAGSESAFLSNWLATGFTNSSTVPSQIAFRADIASSARISVRCEGSAGGSTEIIEALIIVSDTEIPLLTSPSQAVYGVSTGADVKAVTVDCGAVANTDGAYTQLTASASATAQYFYVVLTSNRDSTMLDASYLIDVATGGAGAETVLVTDIMAKTESVLDTFSPAVLGPFPGSNLQSARVAMRCQSTTTDATDRVLGAALLVISGTVPSGGSGGGLRVAGPGGLVAR